MTKAIIRSTASWAVATDDQQWILMYWRGQKWRHQAFVSSSRDILARCMRERGVPGPDMETLLSGLPAMFVRGDFVGSSSEGAEVEA